MNGTLDGMVILVLPKSQKSVPVSFYYCLWAKFSVQFFYPIRTVKQVPVNTNCFISEFLKIALSENLTIEDINVSSYLVKISLNTIKRLALLKLSLLLKSY
jgi:hypothetical protein